MPRRPPIATIKKIAGLAGVSIGTVDRVLHQRGRVSPETEAKIRRIVKDLKYKPNVFARNLKLAKTFVFGVLMPRPDQDSGYWALPLKGVGRAEADLLSQKIRIRRFFYDKHSAASVGRALRKVLAAGLDGLLVAPVGSPPSRGSSGASRSVCRSFFSTPSYRIRPSSPPSARTLTRAASFRPG